LGTAQAVQTHSRSFPQAGELFAPLLADPREIQLSAAYYRLNGQNTGDVALGHAWGMGRWHSPNGHWSWQWNIEAMGYSRFRLSGAVNEFETIDFFGLLPLEIHWGQLSSKFTLFHQSSHLGDDFIRRTRDSGLRYSIDGLKTIASGKLLKGLRLYGGGGYLLHTAPSAKPGTLQWGLEMVRPALKLLAGSPLEVYLAQDFQARESASWNINSRTVLGLRLGFTEGTRSLRVHLGHFEGHSPYGQFSTHREVYSDVGVIFDF
jgi:hypothetical protein